MIRLESFRPIFNSWGTHEKIIPHADALKGLHSRYNVGIPALTYKGYSTGDIQMVWYDGNCSIYNQVHREECAAKDAGLDRDYTASEMNKKFKDLCYDFHLTEDGDYAPQDMDF